ncbi:hypothetical protein CP980_03120 [Streptomyces vinaceus]|uniref:Uncharacterized protein n=1 Tax=Streptomyces vinaceus TaxID=1960 RepID=A0A5J6J5P8_STRVI|nr:hypothetical protein CP980_03120 [Streptomyces vinaceus]
MKTRLSRLRPSGRFISSLFIQELAVSRAFSTNRPAPTKCSAATSASTDWAASTSSSASAAGAGSRSTGANARCG